MSPLRAGAIFANRFEIDRAAGSGGMGTVYRARDQLSGNFVALKLLHSEASDGDGGERFLREAQLLSELRHPGIVAHVTHGQTAHGQRFLAMQWLDGETLAQRLARSPLSLPDALLLTRRVAETLAFTHRRGILHRDLKPTNLFLPSGSIDRVQILDFGIARRLVTSRAMTRTGMVIGTPEYMAPEQVRGSRNLTPAADFFSLGCVLYECLAGEPPFVADNLPAVLVRILFEEPVPITQHRPGMPETVGTLVHRLLAKDHAERLAEVSEITALLESIGDLPNLPLLPTLAAPDRAAAAHANSEQVLLSLVLALMPAQADGRGSTELGINQTDEIAQPKTLLAELLALGVQADLLLGGALVATVPQMASAKDQAALAARCAGLVKSHWPESQIVVVTGRGSRNRSGLSGEVLDRAWRLLGKSELPRVAESTAQIRVDEVSAGLLDNRFELSPLPTLAGAYVLGNERLDPDAGRLLLGKPTPCLGRERELTTLEAVYNDCKEEGLARAVLILGPPGMGKSRVRHEFLRRLEGRGERPTVLLGRGDPLRTKSAYGMLGEALRQGMELRDGQNPQEQRARLRERIASALPAEDALRIAVFIGEICGVPFPAEESPQLRAARHDPRLMSDQVEQAWLDELRLFRSEEPLLLILEDLHWSDALTVKLVDSALRRLRDRAFMVLALARPEVAEVYPTLWPGAVLALPLQPLPKKAGERLVRQILGDALPAERAAGLLERSAGNPLFLEELIRAFAEGKGQELPGTVLAMLQSRLGRLGAEARWILRLASVFGETFWVGGIEALADNELTRDEVEPSLRLLTDAELVAPQKESGVPGEKEYRFHHALVREAAYGLFSEDELIRCHSRAGAYLQHFRQADPQMIAEHFIRGKEPAQAISWLLRAAQQALDNNDLVRAIAVAESAVEAGASGEVMGQLRSIQATAAYWNSDYATMLTYAPIALSHLRRGSAQWYQILGHTIVANGRTRRYEEVARLQELVQTTAAEAEAQIEQIVCLARTAFQCQLAGMLAQFRMLITHLQSLVAGQEIKDPIARAQYHYVLGIDCHNRGAMPPYLDHMTIALTSFEEAGDQRNALLERATLADCYSCLGMLDEAQNILRSNIATCIRLKATQAVLYNKLILGWNLGPRPLNP